jgi:hypothetical protein
MDGDVEGVIPLDVQTAQRIVDGERCPDHRAAGDLDAHAGILCLLVRGLSYDFARDWREVIEVKGHGEAIPPSQQDRSDEE